MEKSPAEKKNIENQKSVGASTDEEEHHGNGQKRKRAPSSSSAAKSNMVGTDIFDDAGEDEIHWNRMLFKLMLYKANNNGNMNVNPNDKKHGELYKWIVSQRRQFLKYEREAVSSFPCLTRDRIKVLRSLDFSFTSTKGDDFWQHNYERLKEYKQMHGHVNVPRISDFPGLGDWVIKQRVLYKEMVNGKPSSFTKTRKDLLDELGFVWQLRKRTDWLSKFDELVDYKEKYGDTKVPQHFKENTSLGKWVSKQRIQYKLEMEGKKSSLTEVQIRRLNELGFVWSIRGDAVDDSVSLGVGSYEL